MIPCVALFRGINVGGNHKVSMAELKALHEVLGLQDVVTYIQSGNVVFRCDEAKVAHMETTIEAAFAEKFGYPVKVMLRTVEEFDAIVARNPFQGQDTKEPKWIVIQFLADSPAPGALEEFQKVYTGPEELHLIGKELYVYYAESIGTSKLSNALLDKKLKTVSTGRNWNTVLKIQSLLHR